MLCGRSLSFSLSLSLFREQTTRRTHSTPTRRLGDSDSCEKRRGKKIVATFWTGVATSVVPLVCVRPSYRYPKVQPTRSTHTKTCFFFKERASIFVFIKVTFYKCSLNNIYKWVFLSWLSQRRGRNGKERRKEASPSLCMRMLMVYIKNTRKQIASRPSALTYKHSTETKESTGLEDIDDERGPKQKRPTQRSNTRRRFISYSWSTISWPSINWRQRTLHIPHKVSNAPEL